MKADLDLVAEFPPLLVSQARFLWFGFAREGVGTLLSNGQFAALITGMLWQGHTSVARVLCVCTGHMHA